jgi:hypothetical protein
MASVRVATGIRREHSTSHGSPERDLTRFHCRHGFTNPIRTSRAAGRRSKSRVKGLLASGRRSWIRRWRHNSAGVRSQAAHLLIHSIG